MKIMRLLPFLAVAVLAYGQATLTLTGPASVKPGQPFTVTMTLAGSQNLPAALEWTVGLPTGAIISAPIPGAATVASKISLFSTPSTNLEGVAMGRSVTAPVVVATGPYSDGVVATMQVTLPTSTPVGAITIPLSGLFAAKSDTTSVPITSGAALAVKVLSFCDVTGDGAIDSADVLVMATALVTPGAVCPISSCLLGAFVAVVNAANGQACVLTQ